MICHSDIALSTELHTIHINLHGIDCRKLLKYLTFFRYLPSLPHSTGRNWPRTALHLADYQAPRCLPVTLLLDMLRWNDDFKRKSSKVTLSVIHPLRATT